MNVIMDEVQTLNKLDHPNIIKYYESYNDRNFIYLVMECLDGQQLFKHITD